MTRSSRKPEQPRLRCCFSDAVAKRVVRCSKARGATRQYRRTVECSSERGHGLCAAWLDHVRRASRFAMGASRPPSALRRGDAIRLQGGGLLGLGDVVNPVVDGQNRSGCVRDVSELMERAVARFGSFDEIPLQPVIRRVREFDTDER